MRRYEGEELNHRSLYLRILRRLWLIPAAAVVCALLFGVVYTIYVTAYAGQRQYKETSKFYVHFAFNENTQTAYDTYNAYTWDDMLYAHPVILNAIEAALPDGMTIDEARQDTEALVLSDIRLLTVEVTCPTAEQASALSDAIAAGLSNFGETMEEFESIEFLSHDEPTLVIVSDRTNNCVILGAVLGALIALLWLLIRETSSDALYTINDLAERFPEVPVLGFTLCGEAEEGGVYGADLLQQNLTSLPDGAETIRVPYGVRGAAARVETDLIQARNEGREIAGLILTDCDPNFLKVYYGTKF